MLHQSSETAVVTSEQHSVWNVSKKTSWVIFVYLFLFLLPSTHTDTQTRLHPTDLPPWPPRSSSCSAICQIYNEAVISYSLVQPLGLQARDCGRWHFSCVQLLLRCTDMLQNLLFCEHILQPLLHNQCKAIFWALRGVNSYINHAECKYWYYLCSKCH